MFRIRKLFQVSMAHQLEAAYSKACTNSIHGHDFKIEVILKSDELNDQGMVVDFKQVKDLLDSYINKYDHALVLPKSIADKYPEKSLRQLNKKIKITSYNPTAERLALEIFGDVSQILCKAGIFDVCVKRVRVHETDSAWAEYEADVI